MSDFLIYVQPIAYAAMACWSIANGYNALGVALLIFAFCTSVTRTRS